MTNAKTLGILQVLCAALLWGTLGLFGRSLNALGVSATAIVTIRIIIAFLGLTFFWLLIKKRLPKINSADLPLLVIYSLISVVSYNFLYFSAISLIPIALAAILLYLSPVFVLVFSALFLKEKITLHKFLSAVIVFMGIGMVIDLQSGGQFSFLGLLYGVGAGVTFALYSVLGKRLMEKNETLDVVTYSFGIGGIGLLLLSLLQSTINLNYSLDAWILLIVLGLVPTLLAFVLYNLGLKNIKASEASIISTIEPVTAAILGSLVLFEKLSSVQVFGVLVVIGGIIFSNSQSFIEKKQSRGE